MASIFSNEGRDVPSPDDSLSISQRFLQMALSPQASVPAASADPFRPLMHKAAQPESLASAGSVASSKPSVPSDFDVPGLPAPSPAAFSTLPISVQNAIARFEQPGHPQSIEHGRIRGLLDELSQRSTQTIEKKLGPASGISSAADPAKAAIAPVQHRNPISRGSSPRSFDIHAIRDDFPALHQSVNGHPLVWFDNAATTHKPRQVIEAMSHFYAMDYSNIHRAAHSLAARASDHYEAARETVREFIHADSIDDIVFVRGTTEGINLIANTCKGFLREGDEILLTEMEHHANIVPWQMVTRETRARIRVIPFNDRGEIMMDEYRRLLGPRTRLVSMTHASNTLGTILPVEEMTELAHHHGARVLVDGAQSIAHLPIDVRAIGCDYFVFSGHKVFAPTGIGAVYIQPDLHELLPPWQGGGNMIRRVTFDETIYADAPAKFEAGTPSIGDAIGLGAALNYLRQFDIASLEAYEHSLLEHATNELQRIKGVTIYGHADHKVGVVSFTLAGMTTEMVGKELDRHGIAVRTGHHCAQPSLRHFGLETTIRPSFALYNTHEEIDRMVAVIRNLAKRR